MSIKNILNKFKLHGSKKDKVESDNSYCYSKIVWNTVDNLMILISFTKDYFEDIIELQDAINYTWQGLCSKLVYSSYEEETSNEDKGNTEAALIIHKKYYMLIGGSPLAWEELYMNIHDLGNNVLNKITDEIKFNCDPTYFKNLIDDGVLYEFYPSFSGKYKYNTPKEGENGYIYTDPEVLIKNLPNGFTGRDILKFIKVFGPNKGTSSNAFNEITSLRFMTDKRFKSHDLYNLYSVLYKDPTPKKLGVLLDPLYKQPDDDSIPGDVSDESLDEIFRERYEKFSAVADDSTHYEDIDEELADDEESENMREEDKI